jgi:hypothetical protein
MGKMKNVWLVALKWNWNEFTQYKQISNLVCTTHFWNNLHQDEILERKIILKYLGAIKPKGLHRIAKIY